MIEIRVDNKDIVLSEFKVEQRWEWNAETRKNDLVLLSTLSS